MVAALVAGALFTKQLLWSPISAINMHDVISNQFRMSGASFTGVDKEGEPFKITAATGRQEYDNPDVIYLDQVAGYTIKPRNGQKTKITFSANMGEFNRVKKTIRLIKNVRIKSGNEQEIQTQELVVQI